MDTEIQKAIRTLGYGFQLDRFSTRDLLQLLRVEKVYLVSGIIHGVFFHLSEILECAAKLANEGRFTKKNVKAVKKWVDDENRHDSFREECPGDYGMNRDWFPPEFGSSVFEITVIRLSKSFPDCCGDMKSVTQLNRLLTPEQCSNDVCKRTVCIAHIIYCRCDKAMCPSCISGWINEEGNVVDPDVVLKAIHHPMCIDCVKTCSGFDEEILTGLLSQPDTSDKSTDSA